MKRILPLLAALPFLLGGSPCFQQFRPYYVAPQVRYVAPQKAAVVQDKVTVINNIRLVGVPVPVSLQQPIAEQGGSIYGYSTAAEVYGDVNLPLLFDQAGRLASQAQELSASATSGYLSLAESERTRREKAAEIIAAGQAIRDVLSQTKVSRIQTSGATVEARASVQTVPGAPQPPAETAAAVVNQRCIRCHSGASPKGGFDLEARLSREQWDEVLDRISTTDVSRMMPPAEAGGQLPIHERKLLFFYDPEGVSDEVPAVPQPPEGG